MKTGFVPLDRLPEEGPLCGPYLREKHVEHLLANVKQDRVMPVVILDGFDDTPREIAGLPRMLFMGSGVTIDDIAQLIAAQNAPVVLFKRHPHDQGWYTRLACQGRCPLSFGSGRNHVLHFEGHDSDADPIRRVVGAECLYGCPKFSLHWQ